MHGRLALGSALVAFAAAATAAAGASWRSYEVRTGGFAIALPASWVDVSSATPALIKSLSGNPSLKASAQLASQSGAVKLIAVDPAEGGRVYMDAWVVRVGPVKLRALESSTVKQLQHLGNTRGKVTAATAQLPAGPAIVARFRFAQANAVVEAETYVVLHDQVAYAFAFGAPTGSWSKYAATFMRSARTFRFLKPPDLRHVVLAGAQVGKGYKLKSFPGGGSTIGEPTLDLCAGTYPSESLRTGRLQVLYTHPGQAVGISNEVVTYLPGGAQQALAEVTHAAAACARKAVVRKAQGVTTTFKVTRLSAAKLLPGSVAVRVLTTATKGKKHYRQTSIAIYQVKGNTFSGVYTFVTKGTTAAQAIRLCYHAAEQSDKNLGGSLLTA